MISKDLFCSTMKKVRKEYDETKELYLILNDNIADNIGWASDAYVDILADYMKVSSDILAIWMFEDNFGRDSEFVYSFTNESGIEEYKVAILDTPEKFYDLILERWVEDK